MGRKLSEVNGSVFTFDHVRSIVRFRMHATEGSWGVLVVSGTFAQKDLLVDIVTVDVLIVPGESCGVCHQNTKFKF